jgi:hypothetical protein
MDSTRISQIRFPACTLEYILEFTHSIHMPLAPMYIKAKHATELHKLPGFIRFLGVCMNITSRKHCSKEPTIKILCVGIVCRVELQKSN